MSFEMQRKYLEDCQKQHQIKDWYIEWEQALRGEVYISGRGLGDPIKEKTRKVLKETFTLYLSVPLNEPGFQGEVKTSLNLYGDFEQQVTKAIESAQTSKKKSWSPPVFEMQHSASSFTSSDLQLNLDSDLAIAVDGLFSTIQNQTQGEFNSAEIFGTITYTETWCSTGFYGTHEAKDYYAEVCYSTRAENRLESQEFMVTQTVCDVNKFDFSKMSEDSVEGAQNLSQADSLSGGTYDVVIDTKVFVPVLHTLVGQINARQKYDHSPFLPKGMVVTSNAQTSWTLTLDPERRGGFGSVSRSTWGRQQVPMTLVRDWLVENNIFDDRYASYLSSEVTTSQGNYCLEADNKRSLNELLLQGSKRPVLHILELSGLFTDLNTLTFSSEVRLAKVYPIDGRKPYYVKGGSFLGSLVKQFGSMELSSEQREFHVNEYGEEKYSYFGPEYIKVPEIKFNA